MCVVVNVSFSSSNYNFYTPPYNFNFRAGAAPAVDNAEERAKKTLEMRRLREELRRNLDSFVAEEGGPEMCINCSS